MGNFGGSAMAELQKIAGCENPHRIADVIFVHGLDGDARTTWQEKDKPETYWPGWLGEEFPQVAVWSLSYEASSIAWRSGSMPLFDRANNVLNLFEQEDIGRRPIGFVCHSLGGLLIKQVLRNAKDSKNDAWQAIMRQVRFIVFLSTPHSGSGMANWIQYMAKLLCTTVSVKELEAHHPQLRQLNIWYRDHVADLGIENFVYCEERKTGMYLRWGGILVVDKTSADPGISNVTPISLDEDHISICKPTREGKRSRVYHQVQRMIEKLVNPSPPLPSTKHQPQPDPFHQRETRPMKIRYSGQVKIIICDRLHDSWEKLADSLEIPPAERKRFKAGLEPQGVWEWLEYREELCRLEPSLEEIHRHDLVEVLRKYPQ
jgi:hypothetical protein